MFQKDRYPVVAQRRNASHGLRALAYASAVLAAFGSSSASAGTTEEIARIENGLRPAVALADAPVATRTLLDEMKRLHVPGVSVAVIRDGKIAWARGFGVAYANGPAVTPQTLFQAASISKPVTALAALKMVEEGKLALDADINTVLTSWKLPSTDGAANVSLRQLLSHTAGTSVSGFPGYASGKPVPTLVQVLDGAAPANTKPVRVDGAPGKAFRYSGGGYSVVQQALVDRSGRPFAALLFDTVLEPLGMGDSSFAQPLPGALQARVALPHDRRGEPYPGGAYTYPELAAAGLWSTPTDLAKFVLEVQRDAAGRGKGLLSKEMARTMLTPVQNGYGLGVQVDGAGPSASFAHGGSNMGYQNTLFAYSEHGDGAVVMTNGDAGGELAQSVVRAIAAEYKWPSQHTRLRKAVALDAARRAALPGRYATREIGDFRIEERNGQLMIALRPGQFEPLYAESGETLFVLSREADLHMAPDANSGRLVSGAFDIAFKRAE